MTDHEREVAKSRPYKKAHFEQLINGGETFVHINTAAFGVRVPERLKKDKMLVLKFSKRYEYKLEIEEEGISQPLSFQGEWYNVFIAWDAIYLICHEGNENVRMWLESTPNAIQLRNDEKPLLN